MQVDDQLRLRRHKDLPEGHHLQLQSNLEKPKLELQKLHLLQMHRSHQLLSQLLLAL